MITDNQFDEMVDLQDRLNRTIDKKWRDADNDWGLAIMAECMELIDHVGWKWWKDRPPLSLAQAQLEVADVWHFILSLTIAADHTNAVRMRIAAEPDVWLQDRPLVPSEVVACAKGLILVAGAPYDHPGRLLGAFFMLMRSCRLSFDDLNRIYTAKAVLNLFRQGNGYLDGTYRKQWGGREDNEHLERLMLEHPRSSPSRLMQMLERSYACSSTKDEERA